MKVDASGGSQKQPRVSFDAGNAILSSKDSREDSSSQTSSYNSLGRRSSHGETHDEGGRRAEIE